MKRRILSVLLCLCMVIGLMAGCGGSKSGKPDALVVMIEQPDGLFNPFFSTAAADGTIVSMTQIGMLGADYDTTKKEVVVAYGDNQPVVTKDYEVVENADGTITYLFVLKNGILFSDGQPLTMEDVLFNYYVYLDPVYTGSNTLYSTKILGLTEYRTQTISSTGDGGDSLISQQAGTRGEARRMELVNLYVGLKDTSATGEVSYSDMKQAILAHSISSGYKSAISNDASTVTNQNLLTDYETALKLFKEELGTDYDAAQESFTDEPYKSHSEFNDPVFKFMYMEGQVSTKYAEGADGKVDRTKIVPATSTPRKRPLSTSTPIRLPALWTRFCCTGLPALSCSTSTPLWLRKSSCTRTAPMAAWLCPTSPVSFLWVTPTVPVRPSPSTAPITSSPPATTPMVP